MIDITTAWLDAAGSVPMLQRDEVIELARTIQADPESRPALQAINKLVASNLRLVAKVWKSNFSFVEAHDPRTVDLLQEGALGVRHAALKYDPTKGFTFSTYAVAWIRRYMGVFLRDKDRTIRLSADCYAVGVAAGKFREKYLAEHGKQPSLELIAKACKKKPDSCKRFLEAYERCNAKTSLDQQVRGSGDNGGTVATVADFVTAPAQYDLAEDKRQEKLDRIIDILFEAAGFTEAEKTLVRQRDLTTNPIPFQAIALEVGIRPNSIRAIYNRCIRRLRKAADASGISITGTLCRA